MRYVNSILVMVTVLYALPALAGTWTVQRSEADGATATLAIVDRDRVIAYGFQKQPNSDDATPTWLTTSNGGEQWDLVAPVGHAPGAMVMIMDLACPAANRCYALGTSIDMGGASGQMIKNFVVWSTDAGGSWISSPNPNQFQNPSWSFSKMFPVTDKELWLAGGANVIVKSINGGGTFQQKTIRLGDELMDGMRDLAFIDSMLGYGIHGTEVEGSGGTVTIQPRGAFLKTTDGGDTWIAVHRDALEYPESIRFLDANLGFMAGRTPAGVFFRRTENGGQDWTDIPIPANSQYGAPIWLDSFHVFDRDNAFVVASGPVGSDQAFHNILEMRDGNTLVPLDPDPLNNVGNIQALDCLDRNLCYFGGFGLSILKYEGTDPIPGEDEGPAVGDHASGSDLVGQDVTEQDGAAVTDLSAATDGYTPKDLAMYGGSTPGGKGSCNSGAGGTTTVLALLAIGLAVLGVRRHSRQSRRRPD